MKHDYEEWKAVLNFSAYEVSSFGRVRSWRKRGPGRHHRRKEPFLLKLVENSDGYLYIMLYDDNGINKQGMVYRLVLESFVGSCPVGQQGRHLDGNKKNNRLENLAWGTSQDNTNDAIRHGTVSRTSIQSWTKLTYKEVGEIKGLLKLGLTSSEIAKKYPVGYGTINFIKRGITWKEAPCTIMSL